MSGGFEELRESFGSSLNSLAARKRIHALIDQYFTLTVYFFNCVPLPEAFSVINCLRRGFRSLSFAPNVPSTSMLNF